jgi:uncharacterized protein YndB with AHSA1/START domain
MTDYGQVSEPGTIRFERLLPGPIERVWRYLTDSDRRGTWLAEGEMELRDNAPFTLYFLHADLSPVKETIPERYRKEFESGCTLDCRVTRVEAPQRLSFLWGGDSEVTFELEPKGDRVLLVLTHRLLPDDQMVSVAAGWHTHLGILVDHAEGREPRPFWSEHQVWEDEYNSRIVTTSST